MRKAVKIIVLVVFLFSFYFLFSDKIEDFLIERYEQVLLEDSSIIEEVNRQRQLEEVPSLLLSEELSLVAEKKLEDMFLNSYFEHTSPDGKEVNHLAEEVGYDYILVGENLLQGRFKDEKEVVQAWMDSPGHRKNILNEKYTETGVASRYGDFLGVELFMSVQVFATPTSACPGVDKGILSRIEEKEDLIDEIRKKMDKEEDVNLYNNLVDEHNEIVSRITSLIEKYNRQVESQESCFSQFR